MAWDKQDEDNRENQRAMQATEGRRRGGVSGVLHSGSKMEARSVVQCGRHSSMLSSMRSEMGQRLFDADSEEKMREALMSQLTDNSLKSAQYLFRKVSTSQVHSLLCTVWPHRKLLIAHAVTSRLLQVNHYASWQLC